MNPNSRLLTNVPADFQAIAVALVTLQGAGILNDDEAYRLLVDAGMIDDIRGGAPPMDLLLEIWNHGFGSGVGYARNDTKRCAEDVILAILAERKARL